MSTIFPLCAHAHVHTHRTRTESVNDFGRETCLYTVRTPYRGDFIYYFFPSYGKKRNPFQPETTCCRVTVPPPGSSRVLMLYTHARVCRTGIREEMCVLLETGGSTHKRDIKFIWKKKYNNIRFKRFFKSLMVYQYANFLLCHKRTLIHIHMHGVLYTYIALVKRDVYIIIFYTSYHNGTFRYFSWSNRLLYIYILYEFVYSMILYRLYYTTYKHRSVTIITIKFKLN